MAPALHEASPAPPSGPTRAGRHADRGRPWLGVFWVLLAVLIAAPVVTATVQAIQRGWVPQGDDAIVTMHAADELSSTPPLVGMPSTLGAYGSGPAASHPGPAEFELLAIPYRLTGGAPWSLLVTAAVLNLASLAVALCVLRWRAGPVVAAVGGLLCAGVLWGLGSQTVREILNPSIALLPLLCFLVLAAAVVDGAVAWFPVAVVFGSFVLQCHLSSLGIVGVVGLTATVASCLWWWLRRDRGRRQWRWMAAALVAGVVVWLPPLIQQLTGDPGNLASIAGGFTSPGLPHAGFAFAVEAVGRVVGAPLLGLWPRSSLIWTLSSPPWSAWLLFLLPWAVLAALAVVAVRRRRWASLRVLAAALAALLALTATATLVPRNAWLIDGHSVALAYPVAAFVWLAIAWAALRLLPRRWLSTGWRARPAARPVAAVLTLAALTAVTLAPRPGTDPLYRGKVELTASLAAALGGLPARPRYRILTAGALPFISLGSGLAVALERRGQAVCIDLGIKVETFPFRSGRRCRPGASSPTLLLRAGDAPAPTGARLLADVDAATPARRARLHQLRAELHRAVRDGRLRLTARGRAVLDGELVPSPGPLVGDLVGDLQTLRRDPAAVIAAGRLPNLVEQGLVRVDGVRLTDVVDAAELATLTGPEGRIRVFLQPAAA